jgi:hypothetical protein
MVEEMSVADARTALKIPEGDLLTETLIKRQYRRLALQYHPDKSKDLGDLFTNLSTANNVLLAFLEKQRGGGGGSAGGAGHDVLTSEAVFRAIEPYLQHFIASYWPRLATAEDQTSLQGICDPEVFMAFINNKTPIDYAKIGLAGDITSFTQAALTALTALRDTKSNAKHTQRRMVRLCVDRILEILKDLLQLKVGGFKYYDDVLDCIRNDRDAETTFRKVLKPPSFVRDLKRVLELFQKDNLFYTGNEQDYSDITRELIVVVPILLIPVHAWKTIYDALVDAYAVYVQNARKLHIAPAELSATKHLSEYMRTLRRRATTPLRVSGIVTALRERQASPTPTEFIRKYAVDMLAAQATETYKTTFLEDYDGQVIALTMEKFAAQTLLCAEIKRLSAALASLRSRASSDLDNVYKSVDGAVAVFRADWPVAFEAASQKVAAVGKRLAEQATLLANLDALENMAAGDHDYDEDHDPDVDHDDGTHAQSVIDGIRQTVQGDAITNASWSQLFQAASDNVHALQQRLPEQRKLLAALIEVLQELFPESSSRKQEVPPVLQEMYDRVSSRAKLLSNEWPELYQAINVTVNDIKRAIFMRKELLQRVETLDARCGGVKVLGIPQLDMTVFMANILKKIEPVDVVFESLALTDAQQAIDAVELLLEIHGLQGELDFRELRDIANSKVVANGILRVYSQQVPKAGFGFAFGKGATTVKTSERTQAEINAATEMLQSAKELFADARRRAPGVIEARAQTLEARAASYEAESAASYSNALWRLGVLPLPYPSIRSADIMSELAAASASRLGLERKATAVQETAEAIVHRLRQAEHDADSCDLKRPALLLWSRIAQEDHTFLNDVAMTKPDTGRLPSLLTPVLAKAAQGFATPREYEAELEVLQAEPVHQRVCKTLQTWLRELAARLRTESARAFRRAVTVMDGEEAESSARAATANRAPLETPADVRAFLKQLSLNEKEKGAAPVAPVPSAVSFKKIPIDALMSAQEALVRRKKQLAALHDADAVVLHRQDVEKEFDAESWKNRGKTLASLSSKMWKKLDGGVPQTTSAVAEFKASQSGRAARVTLFCSSVDALPACSTTKSEAVAQIRSFIPLAAEGRELLNDVIGNVVFRKVRGSVASWEGREAKERKISRAVTAKDKHARDLALRKDTLQKLNAIHTEIIRRGGVVDPLRHESAFRALTNTILELKARVNENPNLDTQFMTIFITLSKYMPDVAAALTQTP